jgi:hypothetical protein
MFMNPCKVDQVVGRNGAVANDELSVARVARVVEPKLAHEEIRPRPEMFKSAGALSRYSKPGSAKGMNADERAALIKRYKEGHRAVMDALRGIDEGELDRSAGGEWTPRQIAHHLADSEMTSGVRLRRLIVEESPVIQGYDEAEFAMRLTSDRPIAPSLEVMRYVRESSAQILDRLSESDWQRAGTHSESGPYSVEDWLTIYAAHGHDHAAQIKRSRGSK